MLNEMVRALDSIGALATGEEQVVEDLPKDWTVGDLIGADQLQPAKLSELPLGVSPSENWLPDPDVFQAVETGDLESEDDEFGIDRIAWYRSFRNQHARDGWPWGIYVTTRGLALLAGWVRMYEGGVEPYL